MASNQQHFCDNRGLRDISPFGATMNATFKAAALVAASCLFFSLAQASTNETSESGTETSPGVIEKTGNAVEHGAKATASGIERGAKATVRGVKRGAKAAANGIERGARATGKAAHKVAKKIGISNTADTESQDAKP
jgi:hypothetical protein